MERLNPGGGEVTLKFHCYASAPCNKSPHHASDRKSRLEANAVSVRVHGQGNLGVKPRDEVIAGILAAIKEWRAYILRGGDLSYGEVIDICRGPSSELVMLKIAAIMARPSAVKMGVCPSMIALGTCIIQ